MGLRFRKSIKLGKGVRLNLGKKSVGMSFGGKAGRYSINSSGRRTRSMSIPGTGLSYVSSSGGKSSKKRSSKRKGSNKGSYNKARSTSKVQNGVVTGIQISAVVIGVFILLVIAVVSSYRSAFKSKELESLKWYKDSVRVTDSEYTQDIRLRIEGDYKGEELSKTGFKIDSSAPEVCDIEYDSADYKTITFKVTPLKDGYTDVTVSYGKVKSEPLTITIDIGEISEDTAESAAETTTEPAETTTTEPTTEAETETEPTETTTIETTTTVQQNEEVIVYITPTGEKYHTRYCRYYSDSCTAMTEEEAQQAGYTACAVCH